MVGIHVTSCVPVPGFRTRILATHITCSEHMTGLLNAFPTLWKPFLQQGQVLLVNISVGIQGFLVKKTRIGRRDFVLKEATIFEL